MNTDEETDASGCPFTRRVSAAHECPSVSISVHQWFPSLPSPDLGLSENSTNRRFGADFGTGIGFYPSFGRFGAGESASSGVSVDFGAIESGATGVGVHWVKRKSASARIVGHSWEGKRAPIGVAVHSGVRERGTGGVPAGAGSGRWGSTGIRGRGRLSGCAHPPRVAGLQTATAGSAPVPGISQRT